MPETVPSWTTEDGRVHTQYIEALKHELFMWLKKVGENEVGARNICNALTIESIPSVMAIMTDISRELEKPAVFKVVRED